MTLNPSAVLFLLSALCFLLASFRLQVAIDLSSLGWAFLAAGFAMEGR